MLHLLTQFLVLISLKANWIAFANLTGSLEHFWKILSNGNILNWNGDLSPVVHQLEHFDDEMIAHVNNENIENNGVDKEWQAIKATRCLWGCESSPTYV